MRTCRLNLLCTLFVVGSTTIECEATSVTLTQLAVVPLLVKLGTLSATLYTGIISDWRMRGVRADVINMADILEEEPGNTTNDTLGDGTSNGNEEDDEEDDAAAALDLCDPTVQNFQKKWLDALLDTRVTNGWCLAFGFLASLCLLTAIPVALCNGSDLLTTLVSLGFAGNALAFVVGTGTNGILLNLDMNYTARMPAYFSSGLADVRYLVMWSPIEFAGWGVLSGIVFMTFITITFFWPGWRCNCKCICKQHGVQRDGASSPPSTESQIQAQRAQRGNGLGHHDDRPKVPKGGKQVVLLSEDSRVPASNAVSSGTFSSYASSSSPPGETSEPVVEGVSV